MRSSGGATAQLCLPAAGLALAACESAVAGPRHVKNQVKKCRIALPAAEKAIDRTGLERKKPRPI